MDLVLASLAFLLIALVSGNNLQACSGSVIGSRILSKRRGIALAIMGYIAGFILQGGFLRKGLFSAMPNTMASFTEIALVISVIIFMVAHKMRVPQSLSMTFFLALLGANLAMGESINTVSVGIIVVFWIAATIISMFATGWMLRGFSKILYNRRVWRSVRSIKALLILMSFVTAFTLGANTMGLVFASTPGGLSYYAVFIVAIIIGSIGLSSGELKRVNMEIIPLRYLNALVTQTVSTTMVEIATLAGIPLSNTQTYTASVYGTGLGYKTRILLRKPAFIILKIWIGTAIASLVLGYILVLI